MISFRKKEKNEFEKKNWKERKRKENRGIESKTIWRKNKGDKEFVNSKPWKREE